MMSEEDIKEFHDLEKQIRGIKKLINSNIYKENRLQMKNLDIEFMT